MSIKAPNWLMLPAYITTYDLMGMLGISLRQAQKLCRETLSRPPYMAAFKLGGEWRIDPEGYERWNGDCHFGRLY